jgi:hypothetical protein
MSERASVSQQPPAQIVSSAGSANLGGNAAVASSACGCGRKVARLTVWLLVLLAVTVIYFSLRWYYVSAAGVQILTEALTETERQFPGWDWESLRRNRDFAPKDDQGCTLLESLYQELTARGFSDAFSVFHQVGGIYWPHDWRRELDLNLPEMRSTRGIRKLRSNWPELRDRILEFRRVPPGGRMDVYPLSIVEIPNHHRALDMLVPLTTNLALMEIEDGRAEQALDYVDAFLGMANAVRDEPTVLAFCRCAQLELSAVRLLEWVLSRGEVSDKRLSEIHERLLAVLPQRSLERVIRGERARTDVALSRFGIPEYRREFMRQVRQTCAPSRQYFLDEPLEHIQQTVFALRFHYHAHTWLPYTRAQALRYFNEAYQIAQLPPQQFDMEVTRFLSRWEGRSIRGWCDSMWLAALGGSGPEQPMRTLVRMLDERDGGLSAAILAVGLERYRLRHGHWPARFQYLPENWLPNLARFDAKRDFRLHSLSDGLVVQVRRRESSFRGWSWPAPECKEFASDPASFILFETADRLYVRQRD